MAREESLEKYNHVDLLFPSKYLKAADLRGKHVTVEVESIDPRSELQMRGGKKEKKPVVYLRGKEKAWVLNRTNAQSIAKVWGNEVTKWIGKQLVIYGTRVQFGPQTVEAIRVDEGRSAALAAKNGHVDPPHDAETGEIVDHDYGPPPMTDDEPGGAEQ